MKAPNSALALNSARALFWVTLLVTFVIAVMPASQAPQLFPWDKAEHFAAFYTLSCLALLGYPRASLMIVGLWLSLFGTAIELTQALPFVHRDCDIFDWVADVSGITAAFAPTFLGRWRSFVLPQTN